MVQTKVVVTWGKQQIKSGVFKTEDGTGKNSCHNQHPKQHPAEHLQVSAKCQHLVVITHSSALAEFVGTVLGQKIPVAARRCLFPL